MTGPSAKLGRLGFLLVAAAGLAGCEPGPGEWALRSGTIGDWRPHHTGRLFESDGLGQLEMSCGEGPITLSISPDRPPLQGDVIRVPVRYRFDRDPPVAVLAFSNGNGVWLSDPQTATGEHPLVARMMNARQLTLRIDWSATDRQTMRFDVSNSARAVEWLREKCVIRHGPRP